MYTNYGQNGGNETLDRKFTYLKKRGKKVKTILEKTRVRELQIKDLEFTTTTTKTKTTWQNQLG